jgi:hypothetical protein
MLASSIVLALSVENVKITVSSKFNTKLVNISGKQLLKRTSLRESLHQGLMLYIMTPRIEDLCTIA